MVCYLPITPQAHCSLVRAFPLVQPLSGMLFCTALGLPSHTLQFFSPMPSFQTQLTKNRNFYLKSLLPRPIHCSYFLLMLALIYRLLILLIYLGYCIRSTFPFMWLAHCSSDCSHFKNEWAYGRSRSLCPPASLSLFILFSVTLPLK